jgi:formylglycine-generating enzyme required for sulfatase activity
VPSEYDIEVQLQRISHRGPGFNMGLLVGGRQVAVGMDCGIGEKVWGLDFLDGVPAHHSKNPTRNPGSRLQVGKTIDVTIQVRKNHITAICDGETLIDWTGQPERLSLWKRVALPRSDALFFWAQADFVVHKMTLTPRGSAASADDILGTRKPASPRQWPADAPPLAIAPFDAKAHQEAWAKYLGVPVDKEISLGRNRLGQDVTLNLVLIPPGEFLMGTSQKEIDNLREQAPATGLKVEDVGRINLEGPQRRVQITRPFYISRNEFTTDQFRSFVQAQPGEYKTEPEASGKGAWVAKPGVIERDPELNWRRAGKVPREPESPVVNVTWNDANDCCEWLSQRDTGLTFALPTEAQWEYACRAGTTTRWSTGDEQSSLEGYAVFKANWPKNIGDRLPNAFGLCDMHGNVWEWCQDAFYDYRDAGSVDPLAKASGEFRIIRGGSCFDGTGISRNWQENSGCRSAVRDVRRPDNPLLQVGFRVAAAISDDVIHAAVDR